MKMSAIIRKAYAKINLGLDVIGRRPNGYHEVKMVMQTVDLYDELTFEKSEDQEISLTVGDAELPAGADNLICKAAELIRREKQLTDGVKITLKRGSLLLPAWQGEARMQQRFFMLLTNCLGCI